MSYLLQYFHYGMRWAKTAGGGAAAFANALSVLFNASLNNEGGDITGVVADTLSGESAITVNAWAKRTVINQASALVFITQFATQNKLSLSTTTTSNRIQWQIRPAVGDSNRTWYSAVGSYTSTSTWVMITAKVDVNAETAQIYMDGSPVTTTGGGAFTATTFSSEEGTASTVGINADKVNGDHQGNIDEVSIWNKGLSDAEVTELYNSGAGLDLTTHSATANLANWWRMGDGDTHPTILDQAGTSDMTLFNTVAGDIVADVTS